MVPLIGHTLGHSAIAVKNRMAGFCSVEMPIFPIWNSTLKQVKSIGLYRTITG